MVEEEWGEGKGLKFKDCDGDWLKMKNNDDVLEVWNQTKSGVVTLKVFSLQNQVNFSFIYILLFGFVFDFGLFLCDIYLFFLVTIFIIAAYDQLFSLNSNFFHCTDSNTLE